MTVIFLAAFNHLRVIQSCVTTNSGDTTVFFLLQVAVYASPVRPGLHLGENADAERCNYRLDSLGGSTAAQRNGYHSLVGRLDGRFALLQPFVDRCIEITTQRHRGHP